VLKATQAEATSALAEGLAGYANGAKAAGSNTIKLPGGIQTRALPGAIAQTISCATLAAGGSGSVTFDIPTDILLTGSLAGATITYTYNACTYSGFTINGNIAVRFITYALPNYSYTINYNNVAVSGPGYSETLNGTVSCNVTGTTVDCNYQDTSGRSWSSGTVYNNGVLNGSYSTNYNGGVATITYNNLGPTSGTITFTGANGTSAVITRLSATRWRVSITVNGQTTTYEYGS
jgi:hypothetical protein